MMHVMCGDGLESSLCSGDIVAAAQFPHWLLSSKFDDTTTQVPCQSRFAGVDDGCTISMRTTGTAEPGGSSYCRIHDGRVIHRWHGPVPSLVATRGRSCRPVVCR